MVFIGKQITFLAPNLLLQLNPKFSVPGKLHKFLPERKRQRRDGSFHLMGCGSRRQSRQVREVASDFNELEMLKRNLESVDVLNNFFLLSAWEEERMPGPIWEGWCLSGREN